MPMHDLESLLQDPHHRRDRFLSRDRSSDRRANPQHEGRRRAGRRRRSRRRGWRRASASTARRFCRRPASRRTRSPRWCATASPRPHRTRGTETMDFALSANQESIRDAIGKICSRFDDAYWLKKDKEGGYPADFHRALADAGWLGICIPEEYGGSGLGITDAAIMMRTISESGAGMSGRLRGAYERVRAQSRRRVRHQGAVHAHAAADHRRPRQVLLRGDRAQYRAQHHAAEDPRGAQGRQVHRQRPEGLDLDRAGRQQDPAAGAHHAAGRGEEPDARPEPVLHRLRQAARRRARDREDGPQARRLQRIVLREFRDPGRGPPRRGRPRLRIHPARHESRAHPDRGRSGRARPGRAVARRRPTRRAASCSTARSA